MQKVQINNSNDFDDVDLRELFNVLWQGKRFIISVTAFISILGVIYSLLLPNIYDSKAILVPVNPPTGMSGSLGNYRNFAGFAGVNLGTADVNMNSIKAIQKISSLSFFEENILENIYLPDLMAVKSWNSSTNTLIYDKSIFDSNTNTWATDDSGQELIPSAQKSFRVFLGNHLSFSEDMKSGFSTLSIKHQSPYIAKEWAELVVNEVNSFYRQKDKTESEKAVNYLNQQISMTSLSEIKQVLAQLLQEEIKKLTLIEANESYVFEYIDPPAVKELKSEPNRAIICILIAIFGGMASTLYVLIKHYFMTVKE